MAQYLYSNYDPFFKDLELFMGTLKFPTKYDPEKKDQTSTSNWFTCMRMRFMPSMISCYDINVSTKVLYSILARFDTYVYGID